MLEDDAAVERQRQPDDFIDQGQEQDVQKNGRRSRPSAATQRRRGRFGGGAE